jgi:hypothetical protein
VLKVVVLAVKIVFPNVKHVLLVAMIASMHAKPILKIAMTKVAKKHAENVSMPAEHALKLVKSAHWQQSRKKFLQTKSFAISAKRLVINASRHALHVLKNLALSSEQVLGFKRLIGNARRNLLCL